MSEFKLIKKYLDLKIASETWVRHSPVKADDDFYVLASELEKALESACVVYGFESMSYITQNKDANTYQGLLLGYAPIEVEKPVTKDEILKVLKFNESLDETNSIKNLINRLEKQGEIK